MQDVRNLFKAALLIERDGTEAAQTVIGLVGIDVAIALIIAHIRRQLTAPPNFKYLPLDPQINVEITEILKKKYLI